MRTTVAKIVECFSNGPLAAPGAYGWLACGHDCRVVLRGHDYSCWDCGHEYREASYGRGAKCPACGCISARILGSPNPHSDADRLTKIGDEAECERCDRYTQSLAALRAMSPGDIQHARYRDLCGHGILYVYRRDASSPSGVMLAMSIDATKEAEDVLRAKGRSPLSPTEGLCAPSKGVW